jgi:hypothetical protein
MKKDMHTFVVECESRQRNKGETMKTPKALKPLLIPTTICIDISMNFVVGLSKVGKNWFVITKYRTLVQSLSLHKGQDKCNMEVLPRSP